MEPTNRLTKIVRLDPESIKILKENGEATKTQRKMSDYINEAIKEKHEAKIRKELAIKAAKFGEALMGEAQKKV